MFGSVAIGKALFGRKGAHSRSQNLFAYYCTVQPKIAIGVIVSEGAK